MCLSESDLRRFALLPRRSGMSPRRHPNHGSGTTPERAAADAATRSQEIRIIRILSTVDGGHPRPSALAPGPIRGWTRRKAELFQPYHVQVAWERLASEGWLGAGGDEA